MRYDLIGSSWVSKCQLNEADLYLKNLGLGSFTGQETRNDYLVDVARRETVRVPAEEYPNNKFDQETTSAYFTESE
ncbi:hypothetical protein RUM44_006157 [Polyplax serrata]|uniref:Uncharacterized protein n=1 Tax=Polyplax serrata TaxID=468196 RepID=A0ABR1AZ39_POLSC